MKYWWHKHWRAPVIGVVAFLIGGAIGVSAKTETKTVTTTVSQVPTVPGPVRVRTTKGQAEQSRPSARSQHHPGKLRGRRRWYPALRGKWIKKTRDHHGPLHFDPRMDRVKRGSSHL